MARLKSTGQTLGQQVYRCIQKRLIWDTSIDIPRPVVVDAVRVQGNGPWGAQIPVLSLKSLSGEGQGGRAEKPGVICVGC